MQIIRCKLQCMKCSNILRTQYLRERPFSFPIYLFFNMREDEGHIGIFMHLVIKLLQQLTDHNSTITHPHTPAHSTTPLLPPKPKPITPPPFS